MTDNDAHALFRRYIVELDSDPPESTLVMLEEHRLTCVECREWLFERLSIAAFRTQHADDLDDAWRYDGVVDQMLAILEFPKRNKDTEERDSSEQASGSPRPRLEPKPVDPTKSTNPASELQLVPELLAPRVPTWAKWAIGAALVLAVIIASILGDSDSVRLNARPVMLHAQARSLYLKLALPTSMFEEDSGQSIEVLVPIHSPNLGIETRVKLHLKKKRRGQWSLESPHQVDAASTEARSIVGSSSLVQMEIALKPENSPNRHHVRLDVAIVKATSDEPQIEAIRPWMRRPVWSTPCGAPPTTGRKVSATFCDTVVDCVDSQLNLETGAGAPEFSVEGIREPSTSEVWLNLRCTKNECLTDTNTDGDNLPDACDVDIDGDGIDNLFDNCPLVPSSDQTNADGDWFGRPCDDAEFPLSAPQPGPIPELHTRCPHEPSACSRLLRGLLETEAKESPSILDTLEAACRNGRALEVEFCSELARYFEQVADEPSRAAKVRKIACSQGDQSACQ